jgi:hypothetical protein
MVKGRVGTAILFSLDRIERAKRDSNCLVLVEVSVMAKNCNERGHEHDMNARCKDSEGNEFQNAPSSGLQALNHTFKFNFLKALNSIDLSITPTSMIPPLPFISLIASLRILYLSSTEEDDLTALSRIFKRRSSLKRCDISFCIKSKRKAEVGLGGKKIFKKMDQLSNPPEDCISNVLFHPQLNDILLASSWDCVRSFFFCPFAHRFGISLTTLS